MNTPVLARAQWRAVLLALSLAACATSVQQHPEFASGKRRVNAIAVMPVEVTHALANLASTDVRAVAPDEPLHLEVGAALREGLKERGYRTERRWITPAGVAGTGADFAAWTAAYGEAARQTPRTPEAEALMVARYTAVERSAGARVFLIGFELLLSIAFVFIPDFSLASDGSLMDVALIECGSGDVLWSNQVSGRRSGAAGVRDAIDEFPMAPTAGARSR